MIIRLKSTPDCRRSIREIYQTPFDAFIDKSGRFYLIGKGGIFNPLTKEFILDSSLVYEVDRFCNIEITEL